MPHTQTHTNLTLSLSPPLYINHSPISHSLTLVFISLFFTTNTLLPTYFNSNYCIIILLQNEQQARRLELQVMPTHELSEERIMPEMWRIKVWRLLLWRRNEIIFRFIIWWIRCSSWRLPFASPPSSTRPSWKSGDWICNRLGCNEHNFASRMECFKCSAPRDTY
ncbi:hypothetical protein K1719_018689 [Acacia pycnantha]|nr:hypothetical protein K1719_018689 [Acacia pycnantha]